MVDKLDEWKYYYMGQYNNITDYGLADEAKQSGDNAQRGVELLIEVVKEQQETIKQLSRRIGELEIDRE